MKMIGYGVFRSYGLTGRLQMFFRLIVVIIILTFLCGVSFTIIKRERKMCSSSTKIYELEEDLYLKLKEMMG